MTVGFKGSNNKMYNAKSDPYSILGVEANASTSEIKRAYRQLAKKLHPDMNPGDVAAAARFSDASKAYDLLVDSEQRLKFDRGDIYADGTPRGIRRTQKKAAETTSPFHRPRRGNSSATYYTHDFAQKSGAKDREAPQKAKTEATIKLELDFLEAALGCKKTVKNGLKKFDVTIPAGSDDGKKLRVKSTHSGRSLEKDIIIELKVTAHPFFTRKGRNIHLDLPISIQEAVQGAKLKVPTIHGEVIIAVPAGSNSGTVLRIKNNGIKDQQANGDQFVRLMVMLPDDVDDMLMSFVKMWPAEYGQNVRERSGIYKK